MHLISFMLTTGVNNSQDMDTDYAKRNLIVIYILQLTKSPASTLIIFKLQQCGMFNVVGSHQVVYHR